MKKRLIIVTTIVLMMFLLTTQIYAEDYNEDSLKVISAKGKVIKIITEMSSEDLGADEGSFTQEKQIVKVKIKEGKYKGQEHVIENILSSNVLYNIRVEEGDDVVLYIEETEGEIPNIHISSFVRDKYEFLIIGIFMFFLLLIGKKTGLKSIITLTITILIIIKFMLPLILKEYSPILVSVISCIIITAITLFIISGFNKKSYATILGTAAGVVLAGSIAYIIGILAKLTGLTFNEAGMLMYLPQNIQFDYKGLLFAGILIGTLGAVMDVSMSIASSMSEIKSHNPSISRKDLIKSGLNIGTDVMGTMTNTLILAYTGTSIPLLLIFMAYDTPLVDILNMDIIATEIVRAITGSIGIVLSIPFTAFISGYFENKTK